MPFLAAYRYNESGLRKRGAWKETWRLQRLEDAGENVGQIPVPPRYTSADFRRTSYWQARGSWTCRRSGSSCVQTLDGRLTRRRC